jgi:hypothetical protein
MRRRKPPTPRLLWPNGKATLYMTLLRCCETQGAYAHPYSTPAHAYSWQRKRERDYLYRMGQLGWVEVGPYGPRKGQRWRLTEQGKLICDIVTQHGVNAKPILMLLPSFM